MLQDVLKRFKFMCILLILPFSISVADAPNNFAAAKKIALALFGENHVTLYCGCEFDSNKKVDLTSCNMHTATPIERANRIEWEHMMPAASFGRYHRCWTENLCVNEATGKEYKGRKCCDKIDADFKRVEAELYNLWPAVGLINQARSNFKFSVIPNKRGYYGCAFDVDKEARTAEPPARAKGIVARANLFMADKYSVEISEEERALLNLWNKKYPPGVWELQWAENVASIVGYTNPYIEEHQLA